MTEHEKLHRVLVAAVELACSTSWTASSNEEVALEKTLKECGYIRTNPGYVPPSAVKSAISGK